MLRITIFAFLLLASAVSAGPALIKSTRLIEGIVSCGSAGTLLDLTLHEEDGSHECLKVPCELHVGHTYNIDIDFVPSQNHKAIHILAAVKFSDGINHELVNTTLDFEVIGGEAYTVNYPWAVTGALGLGPLTLHIELGNDDVTELCGEADGVLSDL